MGTKTCLEGVVTMKGIRQLLPGLSILPLLWLTGCASVQQPLPLEETFWSEKQEVIGVAIAELPKPGSVLGGQQGLLDLAINTGVTSGMRAKVETWDITSLHGTPEKVVAQLQVLGYQAKPLAQPLTLADLPEIKGTKLGYSKINFSPLKEQEGIDKLVLFTVSAAGTYRTYYSIVPTSDPIAQVGATVQVIDLDDNRLLFHKPLAITRAADGDWDESPDYPNLSNAFYQALDEIQQQFISPFQAPLISAQQP